MSAVIKKPGAFTGEQRLIRQRRAKAGVDPNQESCGLALSGGGIRSATFSLGVLRGIAKAKVLRRFDYLSTVSGGGYIGTALGRLYSRNASAAQVEESVGDDCSLFLWWLRNNGRYLTPRGAKDAGVAVATMLRGWFLSQAYILFVALLLVALSLLPHAIVWALPDWIPIPAWVSLIPSVWWLAATVPLIMSVLWAYVYGTDVLVNRDRHIKVLVGAALLAALVLFWTQIAVPRYGTSALASMPSVLLNGPDALVTSIVLVSIVAILIWAAMLNRFWPGVPVADPNRLAKGRLKMTSALRSTLVAALVLGGAGLLDAVSWYLFASATIDRASLFGGVGGLAGLLGVAIVAMRTVIPTLQNKSDKDWIRSVDWLRVASIVGYLVIAMMLLLCALVLTFLAYDNDWLPGLQGWDPGDAVPLGTLGAVIIALCLLLWTTRSPIEPINLGSLHYFYRARLGRTYVSLGNTGRFGKDGALAKADREAIDLLKRVNDVVAGDDIPLHRYRPDRHGGPLHLINCCINQTRDDRTGNYNADRRGVALAVGPCGLETGAQEPHWQGPRKNRGTLAGWAAMSGAAVGSGMGLYTRTGVAAILYLSGLRLGYWMQSVMQPTTPTRYWQWFPRLSALFSEVFASFPGLRSSYWYVTDGGHFDNTGVYALLKRKLPLIVLVDAAADPDYLFGDVESVVRKAKIDLQTNIEFIDPASMPAVLASIDISRFGTPYSITADGGPECMLLARIDYGDLAQSKGLLLIVKPCRTDGMSLDVVGYADRHPAFPQESTANQFFSEEQWESYHALGVMLGQTLTPSFLAALPTLANNARTVAVANTVGADADGTKAKLELRPPDERRARVQATLRNSLGFGVSISVLIAAWQAVQTYINSASTADAESYKVMATVSDDLNVPCISPAKIEAKLGSLRQVSLGKEDTARAAVLQMIAEQVGHFCPVGDPTCAWNYFPSWVYPSKGSVSDSIRAWYWWPSKQPVAPTKVIWRACRDDGAKTVTVSASTDTVAVTQGPVHAEGPKPAASDGSGAVPGLAASATIKDACAASMGMRQLYPQVYREEELASDAFTRMLSAVRNGGVKVQPTENVTATAKRRGRSAPFMWDRPMVLYSVPSDKACAEAIARAYPGTRWKMLMPPNAGIARTLEFWLPPQNAQNRSNLRAQGD